MINVDKKDCEIGMKIKRVADFDIVDKGKYTVQFLHGKNAVQLEEIEGVYLLENFEPVNKFVVGDEVIYKAKNDKYYKCIIFGIAELKDKFDGEYAISFEKGSGRKVNKIVKESYLSPLKKKEELGVGDKFIHSIHSGEIKVLAVKYDKDVGVIKYFGERLSDGYIDTYQPWSVGEIIY